MMIWCDYCLLVALRFGFHIELAKCLFFRFRSSYLSPKCERHNTSENTTRENWCTLRKSRISCRSSLGSLEQLLSFFRMSLRRDCNVYVLALPVCRHSAHGTAKDLACWHLSLYRMWLFPWQCFKIWSRSTDLPRYKFACLEMCHCNKYWSQIIEWSLHLFQMWPRELNNCNELGTCVGCLRLLLPKRTVSSRD